MPSRKPEHVARAEVSQKPQDTFPEASAHRASADDAQK